MIRGCAGCQALLVLHVALLCRPHGIGTLIVIYGAPVTFALGLFDHIPEVLLAGLTL